MSNDRKTNSDNGDYSDQEEFEDVRVTKDQELNPQADCNTNQNRLDSDIKYFTSQQTSAYRNISILSVLSFTFFFIFCITIFISSPSNSFLPSNLILILLFISAIALISMIINFRLYYTRSMLLLNGPALVPEKWGKLIYDLSKSNKQTKSEICNAMIAIESTCSDQREYSKNLLNSFLTLQETLSEREKEIQLLKEGENSRLYGKFLLRFLRVKKYTAKLYDDAIEEEIKNKINNVSKLLDDALDECGLEIMYPNIGDDFRNSGNLVSDKVEVRSTYNSDDDFKIVEVIEPAYVIKGNGQINVISPAKVIINRFEIQINS